RRRRPVHRVPQRKHRGVRFRRCRRDRRPAKPPSGDLVRRDRADGAMSDLTARVTASDRSFRVEGYERIAYDLVYVDGVFEPANSDLADCYRDYGRALMVIDETVYGLYRERIEAYFAHYDIALTVVPVQIR